MIRTRLSLWNSVVLAVLLTLIGVFVFIAVRASIYAAIDSDLDRRIDFLNQNWKNFPKRPPTLERSTAIPNGVDPAEYHRIQFEGEIARPRIIWLNKTSEEPHKPWDNDSIQRALHGQVERHDTFIEGRRVRVATTPIKDGDVIVGASQFAGSLENADKSVARLSRILLISLPVALVVASLTGVWLTRRALRPVADLARLAEQIEAANLNDRLQVRGRDEFAALSTVFNSMLSRLEQSFRRLEEVNASQRRFVADASHELKTPLTAIKARLGLAKRKEQTPQRYIEHLDSISRSTDAMSAIVGDLLFLAKSEESDQQPIQRILPLGSLVEEAAAVANDAYNRHIQVDIPDDVQMLGNENQISRVFINLLDNAARNTPPEGEIRVCAAENGRLTITVSDTGKGIDAEHLPHVFDRFYRVNAARDRASGGTGLGLAIVKSIIESHNGTIGIESEVGVGTTVTLSFPSDHT